MPHPPADRAPGRYTLAGWEVIPDTRPGEGPLAGLEAALNHAQTPWLAFTGVDLPGLTPGFWGHWRGRVRQPHGRYWPLTARAARNRWLGCTTAICCRTSQLCSTAVSGA
ncbi:NTP transferase domain-containing protein [Deinococcus radiopugnans]|uniref:NTP transferase domain-containing protein n=1 Tax=Deinococcus radiopugnans TaxID=57497 RepID=UPI00361D5C04